MIINISNECSLNKIDKQYLNIVNDGIQSFIKSIKEDSIINIRLLGSVPRGEANLNNSDIDFLCICSEFTQSEIELVANEEKVLSIKYPEVSKVDLELIRLKDIGSTRKIILNTDSITIFGNDLFINNNILIDSANLAELVTPDPYELIEKYRNGITGNNDKSLLMQYSKWIGKDLLKCFRKRLIIEYGIYQKNATKIADELIKYYPKNSRIFNELLGAYLFPEKNINKLDNILKNAGMLLPEFE